MPPNAGRIPLEAFEPLELCVVIGSSEDPCSLSTEDEDRDEDIQIALGMETETEAVEE